MNVRAFGAMAIVGPTGPPAAIGGPLGAALLAVLTAELGIVIGRDRLVNELWSDGSGSVASLRVAVNRLRTRFSSETGSNPIRTEGHGYLLDLPPDDVDVARFHALAVATLDAHQSRGPSDVVAGYADAEACWAGEPFEGIADVPVVSEKRRALMQLRDELAFACARELILGPHPGQARPVLERLVESDPYQEDACALLALALYRQRRQAEALKRLGTLRKRLREDLGIAPSPAVQQLELAILNQTEPELVGQDFLRPLATWSVDASPRPQLRDEDGVEASTDVGVNSKLRAVGSLLHAGVTDEAATIIEGIEQVAVTTDNALLLAKVRLAQAELAVLNNDDPHALIDEAQQIGRRLRDGDLLARAALSRFGAGVPDDKSAALVDLTEPISLLDPTDPRRIDLLCAAAVIVTFIDASPAAVPLLEEAERVHRQIDSTRSKAVLLMARSLVGAVQGGSFAEVEADAEQAFQLARELEDPQLIVSAIQAMLRLRYARGDLPGVDDLLDTLDEAARVAILPFGNVRVLLCRTMNSIARGELDRVPDLIQRTRTLGTRLRTFAAESASTTQQLLLDLELDRTDEMIGVARLAASTRGPTVWNAVLALCGDRTEAASLREIADQVPDDDSRNAFVALAAQVAATAGDAELGAWCAPQLEALGGRTIVVGLGTVVLGFSVHFAGLARIATGELETAIAHLERASSLADAVGANLWRAHSDLELAAVLGRLDRFDEARTLLAAVAQSEVGGQSPRLGARVCEVSRRLDRRSA